MFEELRLYTDLWVSFSVDPAESGRPLHLPSQDYHFHLHYMRFPLPVSKYFVDLREEHRVIEVNKWDRVLALLVLESRLELPLRCHYRPNHSYHPSTENWEKS